MIDEHRPDDRHASGTLRGFGADVRRALSGSPMDYTTGGVGRSIVLLAIPMVLSGVFWAISICQATRAP